MKVYADNAATTRISDTAFDAMVPYFKELYGNPSSLYTLGQLSQEALCSARETVAKCLNCDMKEITFTSGGSEADNQAICWLLGIRFLESPSNILEIGADDLKEELAMSIFAVYLLYTWNYSGMERMWNKNTISDYGHKSHLPYQLRAYRMLSVALSRLQNLGIWCEDGQVCSADGEKIKKEFFEEVKKLAFQMINSFETSLSMFFAKTENIYELAQSERLQELYEMVIKEQDELIPEISKEKVPWLLGYAPEGQAEMKRVHDLWKDVREHLEKNGTYCRLRKFEEWVPLG